MSSSSLPPRSFDTTHWSIVVGAASHEPEIARAALTELCQRYWFPLYAFARRKGQNADDAADLTQAFFARLLAGDDLAAADRNRGRFRSFLLTMFCHFLANEWRAENAQKRGGGKLVPLELDFADGESRYRMEPVHAETPERIFERRWALSILEQALAALQGEVAAAGKSQQFATLRPFLTAGEDSSYADAAQTLGMTEVAVRVAVHRLREKYRRHLRQLVAQTVADEAEVDDELRALLAAVR